MASEFKELTSLTKGSSFLESDFDADLGILYIYQNSLPRFSFSPEFLAEAFKWQNALCRWMKENPGPKRKLRYIAGCSVMPEVFNLGGDLKHFLRLIVQKDKERLRSYAHLCVDVIWKWIDGYHDPHITTICLVQGAALGGGFEGALSSDYLICEKNVKMGLPEIHFNLFPGMGAFHLLSQRIGPKFAEQFIMEGKIHTPQELLKLGIVDEVAQKGKGIKALREFVKLDRARQNGNQSIRNLKRQVLPITYESLIKVTDEWTERAFELRPADLEVMQKLVDLQEQKYQQNKLKIHLGAELKKFNIFARRQLKILSQQS